MTVANLRQKIERDPSQPRIVVTVKESLTRGVKDGEDEEDEEEDDDDEDAIRTVETIGSHLTRAVRVEYLHEHAHDPAGRRHGAHGGGDRVPCTAWYIAGSRAAASEAAELERAGAAGSDERRPAFGRTHGGRRERWKWSPMRTRRCSSVVIERAG